MKQTDEHLKELARRIVEDAARWQKSPAGQKQRKRYAKWLRKQPPAWATFPLDSFDADDGTVDRDGALQWLRENELAAWPDDDLQAGEALSLWGRMEQEMSRRVQVEGVPGPESFVQAPCRVQMTTGDA